MLHLIISIIVAGVAGFIASKLINKSGSGLILDIILGIVGGFVGSIIVRHIPVLAGLGGGGWISELVVAILGAALVIFLYNLIFRRGG